MFGARKSRNKLKGDKIINSDFEIDMTHGGMKQMSRVLRLVMVVKNGRSKRLKGEDFVNK